MTTCRGYACGSVSCCCNQVSASKCITLLCPLPLFVCTMACLPGVVSKPSCRFKCASPDDTIVQPAMAGICSSSHPTASLGCHCEQSQQKVHAKSDCCKTATATSQSCMICLLTALSTGSEIPLSGCVAKLRAQMLFNP